MVPIRRIQSQLETLADPVLEADELGLDPATRELRVGDGSTAWSALSTAGSSTYARLQRPTSVSSSTALTKPYDASRCLYNVKPSNTRRLAAGLAKAISGTGVCSIAALGDSEVLGVRATTAITDNWAAKAQVLAASAGIPNGGASISLLNNGFGESRITGAVGWTQAGLHWFKSSGAGGQTITYTSTVAGTVVEIWTLGTSAGFTYNIDGSGAVAAVPNGQSALQKIVITALANTTHTVVITSSAASAFCLGIFVRQTSGLIIHQMGYSGSTMSGTWAQTQFFTVRQVGLAAGQDATLLSLGVNDALQALGVGAYQSALSTYASALLAAPTDVILVVQYPPNSGTATAATWTTYVDAQYAVADALDLPLIDLTDRFGSNATAQSLGAGNADGIHPNSVGYALASQVVAGLLTSA